MCWKIYIVIRIFVCICLEEYLFPSPKFLRVTVSSTFKYTIQKAKVRSLDRRLNSPTAILLHIPRCIIHPELRNLRRPIPIPSRLSILHDVPLSCITACIEGRGRRSADPLCFDRDFRRPPLPPSSSLLEKIEARGKRRRRSARLVAFRGLWKCVHVEYDPRDENRKSRGLSSLASLPWRDLEERPRALLLRRAAWDYFSDRQPEATGLIIEAGIEAETRKRFSQKFASPVIVERFLLFLFFLRRHFARVWDFVADSLSLRVVRM